MRLADDPDAAAWIEGLAGDSGDFDWDQGNRTKNRKHRVEPEDVESMFRKRIVLAGRIVEPAHDESRWLLLGTDLGGRCLALIFARRGWRVRPICCRPMRKKEKEVFREALGREQNEEEP